mgnify:CR=1 FL=1
MTAVAPPSQVLRALEAALQTAALDLYNRAPSNGPALRRALERSARGVLQGFVRHGRIVRGMARCDDDTCLDADGPVVEIVVWLPRRVEAVVFRLSPF